MLLDEFFDYKNKLMEDLLTTESIVNLLGDDASIENAASLAYTQVFPYEYVPETVEEGKTYICFDVDITAASGDFDELFYNPEIYIWVFSHKSRLRLPEGGVRTDKICAEICKKINGSLFYGLGKLKLYSVKRFAPMTDYQGKRMAYTARDFKMVYNPNKVIPSNRKA